MTEIIRPDPEIAAAYDRLTALDYHLECISRSFPLHVPLPLSAYQECLDKRDDLIRKYDL